MALIVDFLHTPQDVSGGNAPHGEHYTPEKPPVDESTAIIQATDIGSVLNRMRTTALSLLTAEIQLAKNELQEEFTAEVLFTRRVIFASALIIVGSTLLLTGVLIAISNFIPFWLSATVFGAALLGTGLISLITVWRRHASISAIASHLKESLDWSKENI
jgi:uncharacterized membrane protein YqjE